MKKNCADQHSKGYRKYNPETACQPLHDGNSDIIGIDDLLVRKIIGVIKKKSTDTASSLVDMGITPHIPTQNRTCAINAYGFSLYIFILYL